MPDVFLSRGRFVVDGDKFDGRTGQGEFLRRSTYAQINAQSPLHCLRGLLIQDLVRLFLPCPEGRHGFIAHEWDHRDPARGKRHCEFAVDE